MNSYRIANVVQDELCVGCGACISEGKKKDSSMQWNRSGFLVPTGSVLYDEDALKVCPFNPFNEEVNNEDILAKIFHEGAPHLDNEIGAFHNTYVGFSKEFRLSSSSGGIATYIFQQLLKQNVVDHLFIVKEVNGTYEYQFFSDEEDITTISKTRYIPVTMEKLFTRINEIDGRVAVSGVACFIKAIRLKQYYNPKLKDKIPFLVGIICGGLKSRLYTDFLASSANILSKYHNQEYRIKDVNSSSTNYSFGAYDENDILHTVRMRDLGDMWGSGLFKANACDFCDDVTTELADISLGDAWLRPYSLDGKGTSVIITRSVIADKLINDGIAEGDLDVKELPLDMLKNSQQGSFNHRHLGLKYRVRKMEKEGKTIPKKRARLMSQPVPLCFRVVLKNRLKVRDSSITTWLETKNAESFNLKMNKQRKKLRRFTRMYHIIRIIKVKISAIKNE